MANAPKGSDGLTDQQREFVAEMLICNNAGQAYNKAYPAVGTRGVATARTNGNKLLRNAAVALRLKEGREKARENAAVKHDITVETLTQMTRAAYEKAQGDSKGAAAMVSAVQLMGRLHGLIVDKKEDVTPDRSAAAIDARIRRILASGSAERTSGSAGGTRAGVEPDDDRATVPGHGTA